MGACLSRGSAQLLDKVEGGAEAYHQRFLEDYVIGEGEFGQVKMVHDISEAADKSMPKACKILRKGITFKDNTIYSPIKPEVLQGEVEILRLLGGQNYCLNLVAVYESPRSIYIVTDFCGGGAMTEYFAAQQEDLRTEDVSRIAFQLLSAVSHCAHHGVMHRDIKPENIMFSDLAPESPMRLIDFGSGCLDPVSADASEEPLTHTTFAGSAFYISPEMFQRAYTQKTDVWSAGVTLYVLAAGYPADELQKAFNILQTAKGRNLKKLPNLPPDMPDSYYEMLDGLLTYRHKRRPSAKQMLECEFVQFHMLLHNAVLSVEEIALAAHAPSAGEDGGGDIKNWSRRTASIRLTGSVGRHSIFLDFKKFERSLTAVLATMLSKAELERLVSILHDRINQQITKEETATSAALSEKDVVPTTQQDDKELDDGENVTSNEQRLGVILIKELKAIIQDELKNAKTIETMEKLPNENHYSSFAYHVTLLHEFLWEPPRTDATVRRRMKRTNSLSYGLKPGIKTITGSNNSVRSASSLRGGRTASSSVIAALPGGGGNAKIPTVHGSNVFSSMRNLGGGARRSQSIST